MSRPEWHDLEELLQYNFIRHFLGFRRPGQQPRGVLEPGRQGPGVFAWLPREGLKPLTMGLRGDRVPV